MRRALASAAALLLAAAILVPVPAAASKTLTCDEEMVPYWISLASARVPLGLGEGTHTFTIDYDFIDSDGSHVTGSEPGTFEVSLDAAIVPGTVQVAPWFMRAPLPPHDGYPIEVVNPMQPAIFLMGWGNYQSDVGRQAFTGTIHDIVQTVSVDGGPAVAMHFHQTYQVCGW